MTAIVYAIALQEYGFNRIVAVLKKKLGLDAARASELAQAACAKGWERRGQLRDSGRVVCWVISIAINLWRDEERERRRIDQLGPSNELRSTQPSINLVAIDMERALKDCNDRQKYVAEQVFVLQRPASEVAEELGVSPDAINSCVWRLRRLLKKKLS